MTLLPTNYADLDSIHANTDTEGGGGVNGWMGAINALINKLSGAASAVTLAAPTITGYTESVVAIGTVTTAATISLAAGTLQTATLTAATAATFTMPSAAAGLSFVLLLKQDASTGGGTAVFTGVKWPAAGPPTVTAAAGKMDIISFMSDGASWYGSYVQGYTP